MKNVSQLYELLNEDYNIHVSCDSSEMKSYIKNLKNFKGIPPMRSSPKDKILIFAYLQTTKKMETEIVVSRDFLVKDHRGAGAFNDTPCVTVFIRFQDIKFDEAMKELQSICNSFAVS